MCDVGGKVAFITGGSSGIGLGIARVFLDAGMKIAFTYRTKSHLDTAMSRLASTGGRVYPVNVDVTDRAAMQRAADEAIKVFGKVHVLVNNAGVVLPTPLSSTTYDDWDWVMSVNVNGVFNGIRCFLPHIRAHGEGGHVIATSSILGLFAAGGGQAAYCASKFAVIGMMESLRGELVGTNIGVSLFCPGLVSSEIADSNRNRPDNLADTEPEFDAESKTRDALMRRDPQLALDPLDAARAVLQGMRNNDLYILTHREYEQVLRDRSRALLDSLPANTSVPERRADMARSIQAGSIYVGRRTSC
jgi:NAD(P)-dependent dehydrogenase (short-subunit alcohol dehydrogenase family)